MSNEKIIQHLNKNYSLGFDENIDSYTVPQGLNEEIITLISNLKKEPQWLLEWRLKAYKHWLTMVEPTWGNVSYEPIDFQKMHYYSSPKKIKNQEGEIDEQLKTYFEKLGVPLNEQQILAGNIAVDAVLDSESIGTTFKERLSSLGIIFCSFSEAVQNHPDLVKQYLGSVVPYTDNFFATLNSAVFTDGSFCYIPKAVKCPMELSTYFRINQANTGQFERTLIIADEDSYVSYLEGCFLKGANIWTPKGFEHIENIKVKDSVYDHQGNSQSVKNLMRRHYEGLIYSLDIFGCQQIIETTQEHPFLVIPNHNTISHQQDSLLKESQWLKAKFLNEGDLVYIPIIKTKESSISSEDAQLLGLYLSIGSSSFKQDTNQYKNTFSLDVKEPIFLSHVSDLILKKFGEKVYFTESTQDNKFQMYFYSQSAYDWFNYHVGTNSLNHKLSTEILSMPHKSIVNFISSYLRNNTFSKNNEFSLEISSESLVQDFLMLLNRINIFGFVSEITSEQKSKYSLWNILCNCHNNSIIKDTDGFWIPILNISKRYEKTIVYNFEVNNTNTYLVQGISVHNCSAPSRPENQLHAAVVEIVALKNSKVKYSTVQNWYPGDKNRKGGIYNFVTKRGECREYNSHISWTQVETGSSITYKYPSVILRGDNSSGEFYSVALTNNFQQADTGTKMIHLGKNTKSTIISKSIAAGQSKSTYRGLVRISKKATGARNFTQCDSLIFGNSAVYTLPYIENYCLNAQLEHEATTSKLSEEHLFYLAQRGLKEETAKTMLVNGFCKSVFQQLPGEFAAESQKLLEINLEGSLG